MYDFVRMGGQFSCRSRWLAAATTALGLTALPFNSRVATAEERLAWPAPSTPTPVDLSSIIRDGNHYVAQLYGGGIAELTLRPALQEAAEDVFRQFDVSLGAAVVVSIPDGRVLAMAGRAAHDPSLGARELALGTWAPAASVFKVVSAAAMVESAGLAADTRACYHGGLSAVLADNLVDVPRLDRRCGSLGYAIGKSQNAIVAKLATRHLTPESLEQTATAFGFGQPIAFDAPVEQSSLDVPSDKLEFARTAAGFWHSSLSAMHGALLAGAVGNGGVMPKPRLVDRAIDAQGHSIQPRGVGGTRVIDARTAQEVGRMMQMTTTMGTARHMFTTRRGARLLPVDVAGKTGTLNYRGYLGDPALPADLVPAGAYMGYSWFVGYAPAGHPKIAFAVVLGNRSAGRIKATFVARRLITEYLATEGNRQAEQMLAAR